MGRAFFFAALFVLTCAVASPGTAQQERCLSRVLPVTFVDSKGVQSNELTKDDLEGESGRAPVQIKRVRADVRPHRIVILLDVSSSMASNWHRAAYLPLLLAKTESQNTSMALVIFDSAVRETIDFSRPQSEIVNRLREIDSQAPAPKSRTAIYDALLAGLRLLASPTSADALYLISDGSDTASHTKFKDLESAMALSGVRLFVSGVFEESGNRSRTPEEEAGPANLDELVKLSGGELDIPYPPEGFVRKPDDQDRVSEEMKKFFSRIVRNQIVEIELPNSITKTAKWSLQLSEQGKQHWGKAQLFYPRQLIACQP
jgi:VWA domain-containing protein